MTSDERDVFKGWMKYLFFQALKNGARQYKRENLRNALKARKAFNRNRGHMAADWGISCIVTLEQLSW